MDLVDYHHQASSSSGERDLQDVRLQDDRLDDERLEDDCLQDGRLENGCFEDAHLEDGRLEGGRLDNDRPQDVLLPEGHGGAPMDGIGHMDGAVDSRVASQHDYRPQVDRRPAPHREGSQDGCIDDGEDGNVIESQLVGPSMSHEPLLQSMTEMDRLDELNAMHELLLNPQQDYVVSGHLARVHATGRRSQVLDVGTGTGTWAINLARRYPFTDVVGVDIDWKVFRKAHLQHGNADFYTVDVTQPLPWAEDSFDIIHVKAMLMDVPQYPHLIAKLARILRPGGLMVIVESELSYQCLDGGETHKAVASFTEALKTALASIGTDVDISPHLDGPLADTGLFSSQYYFQVVGCPIGSFLSSGSQKLQHAERIHRSVLRGSLAALVCPRIPPGPERTHLETLIEACTTALCSPGSQYIQRLFAVYAYKKYRNEGHITNHSI